MIIKKKRIVITGGTSGIGYEMAKYFHADNQVIVVSRDENKLETLQQELVGLSVYPADLSNLDEVEQFAVQLKQDFNTIDLLINNAAVQHTPTFLAEDFRYETIAEEINLNFTSICCLCALLLPQLRHEKPAVILNINSGLALTPKTSAAIYCATKGALNIFTQSLRYQLNDTNISVQQVFLELVDTAMTTGRGSNKMSRKVAALKIIKGIERGILDHDIGKVKLLRFLLRLMPSIAKKIMMKS
ncbi:MAG: SDR family NAD(P)-dependent oxidoreductase [Cocleimonas sp.]|nr:SDR family NAD(P)-dependent oxidoreductase [Cocleimonas sp.]